MISQAMATRIERWSLDRLIPFARNPRTHSEAQVAQIAASIVEFGVNKPAWWTSARGTRCRILCSNTHPDPYPSGPSAGLGKICKVLVSLVTQQRLPANRAAGEIA